MDRFSYCVDTHRISNSWKSYDGSLVNIVHINRWKNFHWLAKMEWNRRKSATRWICLRVGQKILGSGYAFWWLYPDQRWQANAMVFVVLVHHDWVGLCSISNFTYFWSVHFCLDRNSRWNAHRNNFVRGHGSRNQLWWYCVNELQITELLNWINNISHGVLINI